MLRPGRIALWSVPVLVVCAGIAIAQQNGDSKTGSGNKTEGKQSQASKETQGSRNQDDAGSEDVDPSQYVGADVCGDCHEEVRDSFPKNPHSKTLANKRRDRQGCEACHGPGRSHAEAGDPASIVRFPALARAEASKTCLTCHFFSEKQGSPVHQQHSKADAGCLDCHTVHTPRVREHLLKADKSKLCSTCHADKQH